MLDNHDGELEPTLAVRQQVIRRIRQWKADVVIAPRPNDYHPDHRYTGVLVQDAAYMVIVPNVCPDTPPLRKNPVFLYSHDHFQRPNPFRPDVVVAIDSVIDKKIDALDAHVSQVYEWLPWVDGVARQRAEGPRGAARLAAPAAERPADRRRRARPRCASGTGPRADAREERRGLRGLRVRPPAERGRPAAALPVLRLTHRPGGPGGAAVERPPEAVSGRGPILNLASLLAAALSRRERGTPAERERLDARTLRRLARPLAVVYTDTADFTRRVARHGILHFLMVFARAVRTLRPLVARHRGRLVKVEADSLLLAFPDAETACRAALAMAPPSRA